MKDEIMEFIYSKIKGLNISDGLALYESIINELLANVETISDELDEIRSKN